MTDNDNPTNAVKSNTVACKTSARAIREATPAEEQLFKIAERWHMRLKRTDGESVRALAERLSLAMEHRVALLLLDLEEIAALQLEPEDVR